MAKLVVLTEGYVGRNFELKSERTTIGRLEDNAFQIPEASGFDLRHHAFRAADKDLSCIAVTRALGV